MYNISVLYIVNSISYVSPSCEMKLTHQSSTISWLILYEFTHPWFQNLSINFILRLLRCRKPLGTHPNAQVQCRVHEWANHMRENISLRFSSREARRETADRGLVMWHTSHPCEWPSGARPPNNRYMRSKWPPGTPPTLLQISLRPVPCIPLATSSPFSATALTPVELSTSLSRMPPKLFNFETQPLTANQPILPSSSREDVSFSPSLSLSLSSLEFIFFIRLSILLHYLSRYFISFDSFFSRISVLVVSDEQAWFQPSKMTPS